MTDGDIGVDRAADGDESHWVTLKLLPDGRWMALNDCCDGKCKRSGIKGQISAHATAGSEMKS